MSLANRDDAVQSKQWLLALFAIVVIQLVYWLAINPVLLVPKPTPDKLPVSQVSAATLANPTTTALSSARFTPIELPWDDCCESGYRAVTMEFPLVSVPEDGLALVPNVGSDNLRIYVNGSLLVGDGKMTLPGISYHGNLRATLHIPPGLLNPGRNRLLYIMVRDAGTPYFSVGTPVIGDYESIQRAFSYRQFSLNSYLALSEGIGFAAALLAFVLWLRSDRNPAIFWMALLCAAWAMRIFHHRATYPPFHGEPRIVTLYVYVNMVPVALLNFANHWTGHPQRWIARTSVGGYALTIAFVAAIVGWGLFEKIDTADRISMGFGLACALATLALFVNQYARRRETRHLEVAVFVLCATLICHDATAALLDGPYGDHVKRALPVLLLGILTPFFATNVRLFRSMGEFNQLLQHQLAERTAELELAHERETAVVRATTQLNERQRIMRDMHDGLGSQLMSMLLAARRGVAKPAAVAEGLQAVIDEMRLMIDSMDSVGESLRSAFAIFRERVEPRVVAAGIRFVWQDDSSGTLPDYGPRDVLQVFRIMQEAVANALKHANGTLLTTRLTPSPLPGYVVRLTISDDGTGLGQANGHGKGLASMAARAASLGANLKIESSARGVAVLLDLPGSRGAAAMP
jgi:signal transduction histidine kinase